MVDPVAFIKLAVVSYPAGHYVIVVPINVYNLVYVPPYEPLSNKLVVVIDPTRMLRCPQRPVDKLYT
jgi:hypothetical protein